MNKSFPKDGFPWEYNSIRSVMNEYWITTTEAAQISGYHRDHIRRLIRIEEIDARKWGRDWMVSRESLLAYLEKIGERCARRGPKKTENNLP